MCLVGITVTLTVTTQVSIDYRRLAASALRLLVTLGRVRVTVKKLTRMVRRVMVTVLHCCTTLVGLVILEAPLAITCYFVYRADLMLSSCADLCRNVCASAFLGLCSGRLADFEDCVGVIGLD